MSRGLSKQQIVILRTVAGMREGAGLLSRVNKAVKAELYPEFSKSYRSESNLAHTKVRYWHKGEIVSPETAFTHRARKASARVSICRAIKSLIERGLLMRDGYLFITEAGKDVLSVNEPWKADTLSVNAAGNC